MMPRPCAHRIVHNLSGASTRIPRPHSDRERARTCGPTPGLVAPPARLVDACVRTCRAGCSVDDRVRERMKRS
ncbi:hypothetical protein RAJCM14343_1608 [Rhodococcus aetherivorans]|uniref:Uncharacterized protein n=1 Tax=Rhodococcus aetherivorans TaxID=191292 RepID=A0ABQ0YII4_9NOCA|nr:hypothetical protein RAJCM14343_1608 [Rhodococcus aetherivorans]